MSSKSIKNCIIINVAEQNSGLGFGGRSRAVAGPGSAVEDLLGPATVGPEVAAGELSYLAVGHLPLKYQAGQKSPGGSPPSD